MYSKVTNRRLLPWMKQEVHLLLRNLVNLLLVPTLLDSSEAGKSHHKTCLTLVHYASLQDASISYNSVEGLIWIIPIHIYTKKVLFNDFNFFPRYDDDISSSQQLSPRQSTNPYIQSSQYNTAKQPLQYSGRDSIQQKKMPSDWRLQLLQHIERKRIEKGGGGDGPTSPNRDRLHTGLNRNHSSTANDVWKLQKSPEIPPKSERHRSITAPTSLPVESLYTNFDSVRVSEPSGIVSSGGSRLPGRRSSGRYLRARTPGPELGSNLTSTPTDPIHRPKSAMGNLYSSPQSLPLSPPVDSPAPLVSPEVKKKKKKAPAPPPPSSLPPHRPPKVSFLVLNFGQYRCHLINALHLMIKVILSG